LQFFNDTGALLFSWKSARDRDVLGGRAGLTETQFRYLEQPVEDPYDCLPIDWRSWFEQQRKMK
jgi:gluconate kinase